MQVLQCGAGVCGCEGGGGVFPHCVGVGHNHPHVLFGLTLCVLSIGRAVQSSNFVHSHLHSRLLYDVV